ncbi:MAG: thioesterase II family protein [Ruegeria sp.]|uniref:thioesterase II family protein n=1 Tax=Ruegeria sp. TaxID=1879320 RepID=UPI00349EFE78
MDRSFEISISAPDAGLVDDAPRLICFPHAGGSADKFQKWVGEFSPHIELRAVTLPGRGGLTGHPPITAWDGLAQTVAERILPLADRPYALFGHSFGALLAYEAARAMQRLGQPPAILAMAGRAPQCTTSGPGISDLPDEAFLAELAAMNGTPDEVLANRALTDRLLPAIRADFALLECYDAGAAAAHDPLACPILALGSDRDPQVSFREIIEWRHRTGASFDCRIFAGDHFFPFTNPGFADALFDYIDGALNEQGTYFEQAG